MEPEHADLAALVEDVRAQRPPMNPAFAARLEERVASSFGEDEPAPERPARRWQAWRPALALAVVTCVAAVVVLPAVLVGEDEKLTVSEAPSAVEEGVAETDRLSQGESRERLEENPQDLAGESLPAPGAPDRAVERITGLTLTAPDAEVQSIANGAIARVEGFVETSTVDVGEGRATADLTLRVPADRGDDAWPRSHAWPTCASAPSRPPT
ncbi:MAG: DUF4349 domain-containing protein [Actinomycetota bacterium]|nr:DUF4349 domain-containing protein [Actinomycetota bacterium]